MKQKKLLSKLCHLVGTVVYGFKDSTLGFVMNDKLVLPTMIHATPIIATISILSKNRRI